MISGARRCIVAVAIAAGVVAGCGSDNAPGPDLLDDVQLEVGGAASLTESGFEPATLAVEAGQLIEITNDGPDTEISSDDDVYVFGTVEAGSTITAGLRAPGTVTFETVDGRELTVTVAAAPSDS